MSKLRDDLLHLVYDPNAIRLQGLERVFNPFRVLGVERYEIRHVNTLAWLLDPQESHGLGDRFLRLFLAVVCRQSNRPQILASVAQNGLGSIHVQREVSTHDLRNLVDAEVGAVLEGHGDIAPSQEKPGALDLIIEGDDWIVGVEAKVHSSVSDGQLRKYKEALQIGARGRPVCLVFLTKADIGDAGEPGWTQVGWNLAVVQPMRVVLEAVDASFDRLPQLAFVRSFIKVVEEQVATPDAPREMLLTALVKEHEALLDALKWREASRFSGEEKAIIREHSQLINELVRRYVPRNEARVPLLKELVFESGEFTETLSSVSYIRFIPRQWRIVPWMFEKGRAGRSGVECELENNRDKGVRLKIMITDLRPRDESKGEFLHYRKALLDEIQADTSLLQLFPTAFTKSGAKANPSDEYFGIRLTQYVQTDEVRQLLTDALLAIRKLTELIQRVS